MVSSSRETVNTNNGEVGKLHVSFRESGTGFFIAEETQVL